VPFYHFDTEEVSRLGDAFEVYRLETFGRQIAARLEDADEARRRQTKSIGNGFHVSPNDNESWRVYTAARELSCS